MFFPERIRKIDRNDRVLEIGPGGNPHHRSDIFLEHRFSDEEAHEQRGHTPKIKIKKPVVFYNGGKFPFDDKAFDYIICSHVIEHVPDIEGFCAELFRVGRKGYIEFPTLYYEYLYNFSVHLQLLSFQSGELRYMDKKTSGLNAFQPVQSLFYRTLELGYAEIVDSLKGIMFHGIEWTQPFPVRRVSDLKDLTHSGMLPVRRLSRFFRLARRTMIWLNRRINLP
jgi:SAM-dependent methyltransferase